MIDVVIVGAGPNGLMLACELALAGVRPLVLERLTGPTDEQRANGLVGQVIRMLDRRGLYERLSGDAGAAAARAALHVRRVPAGPGRPAGQPGLHPAGAAAPDRADARGARRGTGRRDPPGPRGDRADPGRRLRSVASTGPDGPYRSRPASWSAPTVAAAWSASSPASTSPA